MIHHPIRTEMHISDQDENTRQDKINFKFLVIEKREEGSNGRGEKVQVKE